MRYFTWLADEKSTEAFRRGYTYDGHHRSHRPAVLMGARLPLGSLRLAPHGAANKPHCYREKRSVDSAIPHSWQAVIQCFPGKARFLS